LRNYRDTEFLVRVLGEIHTNHIPGGNVLRNNPDNISGDFSGSRHPIPSYTDWKSIQILHSSW